MDLSIIMINDNKNELCKKTIISIIESIHSVYFEIIVIDFAENEKDAIKSDNKLIKIIRAKNNNISKAYNKGIDRAIGRYILILNNNVVVENNCIDKCIKYIDLNQNVGALGVRILNDSGKNIYSAKKGIPTKFNLIMFWLGIWKIFKKYKIFNGYSLANMNPNGTYRVNSISEIFMIIPRAILYKINCFDEQIYWVRDLDICFKIKNIGFDIIYFGETWVMKLKEKNHLRFMEINYRIMFEEIKSYYDKHYGVKYDSFTNNIAYFFIKIFCIKQAAALKKKDMY